MAEVVFVKLGGSLITDKRRESHARRGVIERLAAEIAETLPEMGASLILGHGSGSFGHVAAARSGLGRGPYQGGIDGIASTLVEARELHQIVLKALIGAGVPAFSWAPSSALTARAGQPAAGGQVEPLWQALEKGMVPVTFGDVVMDHEWGACILSTETLLRYLALRLRRGRSSATARGLPQPRRMLWLGETDGVYDHRGQTVPHLDSKSFRRALENVDAPAGTDVTGGMLLRLETVRALARLGIESHLLDGRIPGLLASGLCRPPASGTRFAADR